MATRSVPAPSPAPVRTAAWRRLTATIVACTRCPLAATRTHAVVYRGSERPRVVFVGEAPGRAEDAAGEPFVGASGRRLDRAIEALGLPPEEVGVVNLLKCRPPDNRFPPRHAATCRPYLERQLALLRPAVVVTLGRHAFASLVPDAPPITVAAGSVHAWAGRPLVPLLHPAAVLHNPRLAERWTRDLDRLGAVLRATLRPTF